MNQERLKILEMLAAGKITATEAEKLIAAIENSDNKAEAQSLKKPLPKYLKIEVKSSSEDEDSENVNIRIPIQLIKSGIKIASLLPKGVNDKVSVALNEKGIDLDINKLKPEDFDELLLQLQDLSIDVDSKKDKVRIFCE